MPYERLARVMLAGVDRLIVQVRVRSGRRPRADLSTMIDMVIAYVGIHPEGSADVERSH